MNHERWARRALDITGGKPNGHNIERAEPATVRLIRQWAIGGALGLGGMGVLFYANRDTLPTQWTLWAVVLFLGASSSMLALAVHPTSSRLLVLASMMAMIACMFRAYENVLVERPGSTSALGILVYGTMAYLIGYTAMILRQLGRK